jgi:hypothetical protein
LTIFLPLTFTNLSVAPVKTRILFPIISIALSCAAGAAERSEDR